MPATYNAEHLTARAERRMVDFAPDGTTLTLVDLDPGSTAECLPIALFRRFLAGFFRTVGTDALQKFEIIAATDGDGTGATVVVSHPLTAVPDAVGDTIWLECDVEQIREVLPAATHVGVRAQFATATDEGVVYFERAEPYYAQAGLTKDRVA